MKAGRHRKGHRSTRSAGRTGAGAEHQLSILGCALAEKRCYDTGHPTARNRAGVVRQRNRQRREPAPADRGRRRRSPAPRSSVRDTTSAAPARHRPVSRPTSRPKVSRPARGPPAPPAGHHRQARPRPQRPRDRRRPHQHRSARRIAAAQTASAGNQRQRIEDAAADRQRPAAASETRPAPRQRVTGPCRGQPAAHRSATRPEPPARDRSGIAINSKRTGKGPAPVPAARQKTAATEKRQVDRREPAPPEAAPAAPRRSLSPSRKPAFGGHSVLRTAEGLEPPTPTPKADRSLAQMKEKGPTARTKPTGRPERQPCRNPTPRAAREGSNGKPVLTAHKSGSKEREREATRPARPGNQRKRIAFLIARPDRVKAT